MSAVTECNCARSGTYWGSCDYCDTDRWVTHRCPFPCDDVSCEGGAICRACSIGELCPVHDGDDWEDES